jgi:alpha-beta hydrolase superfamily lysophospholipase
VLRRIQYRVFTIAVTIVSRLFIAGGRYLRKNRIRVKKRGSFRVRTTFPSGSNLIDAKLVQPVGEAKGAVLICHGIGETVWHWKSVQRLLAQNGVASLLFNYSGWGRSTGVAEVHQCEADALEAFRLLAELMPGQRISLLGYSLGSGVATAIAPKVNPHRLMLCASYTSLRRAAVSMGFPWPIPLLLPPVWDNVAALHSCTVPTVIVHGADDALFSPRMAQTLANACAAPCELIVVPATSHARPIFAPDVSFWGHIIDRV